MGDFTEAKEREGKYRNPNAITIPPTSKRCYLGGVSALNLPIPGEVSGDWHMIETFFRQREHRPRSFISGDGCATNTNAILGEIGIYDCTAKLNGLGIPHESDIAFAANHARAIADLVLSAVMRGGSPDCFILDDWMPRNSDKQKVFDLLDLALGKINREQQGRVLAWKQKNPLEEESENVEMGTMSMNC